MFYINRIKKRVNCSFLFNIYTHIIKNKTKHGNQIKKYKKTSIFIEESDNSVVIPVQQLKVFQR